MPFATCEGGFRNADGGPIGQAPLATGEAAVAGLGPYLRTTRQDSTIPISTTLWPEKTGSIFEEFPIQARLLRRCHEAGYSEAAIRVAILKSASLAPGLRRQWDQFFAKAADALAATPNPIPKPVAAPAGGGLPKPIPKSPAGMPGAPLGGAPTSQPGGVSSGWHFGQSLFDGYKPPATGYQRGAGGVLGDLGHVAATGREAPPNPTWASPAYQTAADHQLGKLAPYAGLAGGLAAAPGGVVATGGAAVRAGIAAAPSVVPTAKWVGDMVKWDLGGRAVNSTVNQINGNATEQANYAARDATQHEAIMQATKVDQEASQAKLQAAQRHQQLLDQFEQSMKPPTTQPPAGASADGGLRSVPPTPAGSPQAAPASPRVPGQPPAAPGQPPAPAAGNPVQPVAAGLPPAPPSPVAAAAAKPEAQAAAAKQNEPAWVSVQDLSQRITNGVTTPEQGAAEMARHMDAFADPALKAEVAGMIQGGKFQPAQAQQIAQKLAPQAKAFGIEDIGKFVSENPMQAAALAIGIPMAVLGVGQGLFGEGGLGSLLMTILGLGGAAFGSGLVTGQGPLGQYAKQFPGMGSVRTLLGMDAPESGGAPPAAAQPVAAGPAAPFDPAKPHGAQLDSYLQSGGVIDPNEQKQILQSPDLRRYLAGAPATDRDRYLRGMMAGDPQLRRGLATAQQGLGAPEFLGGGRQNVLNAAKKQYGFEPQEFDALMDSYRRVGREPGQGPDAAM